MEMNLLRIGQEAVGNAVKHGGARLIRVELRYTQVSVELTVTDDGKGFDAAQPSRTGHFGVQDMRERAQSMGSDLKIISEPQSGTSVSVEVRIDDTVSLPDFSEALDRANNDVTYRAEKIAIVSWDTALQAGILVDWTD